MNFQTPDKISNFFYVGVNLNAECDDELMGISVGSFYVGLYPTKSGFDLSMGILDANGCLN